MAEYYESEYNLTDREKEMLAIIRNDGKKPPTYVPYHSSMRAVVETPDGLDMTWDNPKNKDLYLKQLKKEEGRLNDCYVGLEFAYIKHGNKELKDTYDQYKLRLEEVRRLIEKMETSDYFAKNF